MTRRQLCLGSGNSHGLSGIFPRMCCSHRSPCLAIVSAVAYPELLISQTHRLFSIAPGFHMSTNKPYTVQASSIQCPRIPCFRWRERVIDVNRDGIWATARTREQLQSILLTTDRLNRFIHATEDAAAYQESVSRTSKQRESRIGKSVAKFRSAGNIGLTMQEGRLSNITNGDS